VRKLIVSITHGLGFLLAVSTDVSAAVTALANTEEGKVCGDRVELWNINQ